jgi:hypothetical protein
VHPRWLQHALMPRHLNRFPSWYSARRRLAPSAPVIMQKLDEKNGLAIKFEERTPDAYTAQFNSGEFQVGGSAARC